MNKRLNLKAFRVKHNLNQLEMATKCQVSLSTYNAIENGKADGKLQFWDFLKSNYELSGEQLCELQQRQKTTTQEF